MSAVRVPDGFHCSTAHRSTALGAIVALALLVSACGVFGREEAGANLDDDQSSSRDSSTTPTTSTTSTTSTSSTTAPTTTTTVPLRPQAGGDSLDDPLFAGLGNTGYDVAHYDLDLNLTGAELRAEAEIELVPSVPLTAFNLDLVGMTVDRVFVNGIEATFERAGRELTITPASLLPAAEAANVKIDYRGQPEPIDDPAGPIELGWHTESWGTFVASEPLGAATWFPANDHPQDKATFRIEVTVPLGQIAAGPGLLVSETSTAGSTTFVWEMNDPMATYLASVVTGDFAIFTTEAADGTTIRNVLPTERATQLVPALASTSAMLDEFSRLFGPYPFDSYGVVAVPEELTFALENQTLSLFDTEFLVQRREPVENVLAHELAHQWFGNHVSPETWEDIWLNEGFASWADHYWTELDGGPTFDDRMELASEMVLRPPTDVRPETMFDPTVYLRGALTLEALRRTIGDDPFFRILQTWVVQYGGDVASTEDFLALVRQQSGVIAERLVFSWLYDQTMPVLPPVRS